MSDDQSPLYGSQEYWEERYAAVGKLNEDNEEGNPSAYHAWYYTYEELRPLVLPLILGGSSSDHVLVTNEDNNENETDDKDETEPVTIVEVDDEDEHVGEDTSRTSNQTDESTCLSSEEEEEIAYVGLASKGPIEVLEIGCGDVPLGVGLADDVNHMHKLGGPTAVHPVKGITCVDYSPTVVALMKSQYASETSFAPERPRKQAKTGPESEKITKRRAQHCDLEFSVQDACCMDFQDGSFDLVLEKGTLDAMLSDKVDGTTNCIKTVAECSRVVRTPGCMVIVSHLNANTSKGITWLEDVVFKGLRAKSEASFSIEVHGSDNLAQDGSTSPAVYVVHKAKPSDGAAATIPVHFRSY